MGCSAKHAQYFSILQDDTQLLKRCNEYWQARAKGDMRKAWEYELPYQKYLTSFEEYAAQVGPSDKTICTKILEKDNKERIVQRKITIGKRNILKKDKWIFVKDNWYHKFYQTIFPPETEEEADFQ